MDMEQQTGSKQEKEYSKAVYCHPAYLTYIQSTLCSVLGWMKHKRIKIAGRNINSLRYADDTTQGQDPSSRAMRRKQGTSGYGGTMVLPLEWSRVCR